MPKMRQNMFGGWLHLDPLGTLSTPPDHLAAMHQRIQGGHPAMAPPSGLSIGLGPSRQIFTAQNGTQPSFCVFCLLSTLLNFRTYNN